MPFLSQLPVNELKTGLLGGKYYRFEFYQAIYELCHLDWKEHLRAYIKGKFKRKIESNSNPVSTELRVLLYASHSERFDYMQGLINEVLMPSNGGIYGACVNDSRVIEVRKNIEDVWLLDRTISLWDLVKHKRDFRISYSLLPPSLFTSFVLNPPEWLYTIPEYKAQGITPTQDVKMLTEPTFDTSKLNTRLQKERFDFVLKNRPSIQKIMTELEITSGTWRAFAESSLNPRLSDCLASYNPKEDCWEVISVKNNAGVIKK